MQDILQYGFQSHLNKEFPSQVVIDVTELCNLACIHCPQADFSKSSLFKGRNLDCKLHEKLIDEVARDGKGYCKYLRYTAQGETLMHPHIVDMIGYAAKHSGVSLNITTNGMLLTENKAKAFIEAGVDAIDISIDANSAEIYEQIRKKGDFNIVRTNVLNLINLIKNGGYKTKVVVSFVKQSLNSHESADFERFWKEAGANYVVIRRLHSAGGVKKELVNATDERYPCLYPWERLTLGADGFIHYCAQDWVRGSVVCDFKTTTIKDVWQGAFMNNLRKAHLKNDYSKHDFCKQCPDWSTTRWPQQDRAYSNMMQDFLTAEKNKES